MTTQVATKNIFASLNDDSDNEAPVKKTTVPAKAVVETKTAQTSAPVKSNNTRGERRYGGDNGEAHREGKDNNQRPKYNKDGVKPKGVPAEPHPQDRHSGTGYSGVDKKHLRKGGAGKRNYGTVNDEVKALNNPETEQKPKEEVTPVVVEEAPVEPVVVDNTITVDEYFRRLGVTEEAPVEKAPERKLNLDELKRDKLQVVSSKTDKVIDQNVIKAANSKKNKGPTTYLVGCNSDHSELLGVKTGHTLVKFVVDKDGNEVRNDNREQKDQQPREHRGPRDQKDTKGPKNQAPKQAKKANVVNEADFPVLA